jgi:hypothetical protein
LQGWWSDGPVDFVAMKKYLKKKILPNSEAGFKIRWIFLPFYANKTH